MRFEVLKVLAIITAFWDVTSFSVVDVYGRFGGNLLS
jgi:hypothetical protein